MIDWLERSWFKFFEVNWKFKSSLRLDFVNSWLAKIRLRDVWLVNDWAVVWVLLESHCVNDN